MKAASQLIILASLGAAHGVKGEIRLKSHTANRADFAAYGPLMLVEDPRRSLELVKARSIGKDLFVVKFAAIDHREQALALNNHRLGVLRSQLPPPNDEEFYYSDLIDLDAIDATGMKLGKIRNVINFGAGDILEYRDAHGLSHLIAFTKANIPHIDFVRGEILLYLPDEIDAQDKPDI